MIINIILDKKEEKKLKRINSPCKSEFFSEKISLIFFFLHVSTYFQTSGYEGINIYSFSYFSYFLNQTYVVGTQMDRLNETVLSSLSQWDGSFEYTKHMF